MIGELTMRSPEFAEWWADHDVKVLSHGTKRYHHPTAGELTLDCDVWTSPDGSGQELMVLTAEPGSPSHDALRLLAPWTASARSG